MSVRIAGGTLRGYELKTLPGTNTRPTTGKVRESIFSILQHDLPGAVVLDIFAGSGALAIEAVSRGAADAVMIEKKAQAAAVIKANLEKCDLKLRLLQVDFKKGLAILKEEGQRFDLIFADPPYGLIDPVKLDLMVCEQGLINSGGFLIMEHAGDLVVKADNVIKSRRFGDSAITIFSHE